MYRIAVFLLDGRHLGLPLDNVDRVVRAVAVTPLPKAPAIVSGIVNLHGRVVPVINIRRRLGMPERQIGTEDHFLVARAGGRTLVLVVDSVVGISEFAEHEWTEPESVAPATPYLRGIVKLGHEMMLIQDLDGFLSLDEAQRLDQALLENA